MGSVFESMADKLPALIGGIVAVVFVGASYFIITLDRARADSTSKDDNQVGIKLVLFGLMLAGIQLASMGTTALLSFMLGGFKGGGLPVKLALPPIIVGALVFVVIAKLLLPRTNSATAKQPLRYMLGALGIQYGVMAIVGVSGVLNGLFLSAPWEYSSGSLASTIVAGAIAFVAVTRLGALSGWVMPAPPAPPMQQYPPQGGQSGGYPPPGGGYPPQGGGGYPPR